jgi:hypothetical protein
MLTDGGGGTDELTMDSQAASMPVGFMTDVINGPNVNPSTILTVAGGGGANGTSSISESSSSSSNKAAINGVGKVVAAGLIPIGALGLAVGVYV